jgi:hypothetical protein
MAVFYFGCHAEDCTWMLGISNVSVCIFVVFDFHGLCVYYNNNIILTLSCTYDVHCTVMVSTTSVSACCRGALCRSATPC